MDAKIFDCAYKDGVDASPPLANMVFESRYFVCLATDMGTIDGLVREVSDIYEAWVETFEVCDNSVEVDARFGWEG